MKFRVLKYFVVLAEELHFGRAAEKLAITQPPLSSAIKDLEEEMGVLLFQRSKTMVQLTPAGSAFLVEVRRLLESVSRAAHVARSAEQGLIGRLDIGFGGTLLFRDILSIVEGFRLEAPGIELVLHESSSSEQFEKLLRGQLHAGFVHGSAPPPRLSGVALPHDVFMLCVHAKHPLANWEAIELRDVAQEPFIMFERAMNPVNHDTVISMFSRAGIYPKFVHYTRNWMTSASMVSEGCGMAIVPGSLRRMRMADVRLVPIAGLSEPAHGMLVWNPAVMPPALEKFLGSADAMLQRLEPLA